MASSDIENFASDFDSSVQVNPSPTCAVQDVKTVLARQERAPLEVSNSSNCFQSSALFLNSAAKKGLKLQRNRESFIKALSDNLHEQSAQTRNGIVRSLRGEHSVQGERWWQDEGMFDDDEKQTQRPLQSEETVIIHSSYSDAIVSRSNSDSECERQGVKNDDRSLDKQCVTRQLEEIKFFEEIIDVDREAGFGEDDDFNNHQIQGSHQFCSGTEDSSVPAHERSLCEEEVMNEQIQVGIDENFQAYDVRRYGELPFLVPELSTRDIVENSCRVLPARSSTIEESQKCSSSLDSGLGGSVSRQFIDLALKANQLEGVKTEMIEKSREAEDHTVELHEAVDEQWLTLQSGGPLVDLAGSQRDWERLKGEMQREEEGGMWEGKASKLEQELRRAHVEKEFASDKKPEYIDEVIRDILMELKQGENGDEDMDVDVGRSPLRTSVVLAAIGKHQYDNNCNPYRLIIMAFEELLREVEERANKNKKALDDVVRAKEAAEENTLLQHRKWSEIENQLGSRISVLELEHGRLSDMLTESAVALTLEKERRKESRAEVDRILEMLRKEKKSHHETAEKLNTCVNSLMKLRGNLAMQKSRSAEDGGPSYLEVVESVLRDMDRELQINLNFLTQSTRRAPEGPSGSSDIDEVTRLKQQRDAIEKERDKGEEKMSTLLRQTREGHAEMELLWLEREKLLEQKIGCLELELQHFQLKQERKEAEVLSERRRWEEELEKCKQGWARERVAWAARVREREEIVGEKVGCNPKHLKEDLEDTESDSSDREMTENHTRRGPEVRRREKFVQNNRVALNEFANQSCVHAGSLVLGMEAGVERVSGDHKLKEWEMERLNWNEASKNFKRETRETGNKLSETPMLVEELRTEIKGKEVQMEMERKQVQSLLLAKAAEVEKLKEQLKSKEHDMEVTVQKFTDELRLIDKEVEKERKEREQVMELHFESKRKVVSDIKEKEERWERALDGMNEELNDTKMELESREVELKEIRRSLQEERSLREREKTNLRRELEEMLANLWSVCEEERIQQAVAKRLGRADAPVLRSSLWESLWQEHCQSRGVSDGRNYVEWETAVGRVANLENQISEAMCAIDSLRDELNEKENQLSLVKTDRKREKDWERERENLLQRLKSQQQKEEQLIRRWQSKEQELVGEKETLEKLREAEREESAETISNLQGAVRELEWYLKRLKNSEAAEPNSEGRGSVFRRRSPRSSSVADEVVKVHTSYLEEVDRYIFDLERNKDMSDKNRNGADKGDYSHSMGDARMTTALMQIEREMYITPKSRGHPSSMLTTDDDEGSYSPQFSRDSSSPQSRFGGTGFRSLSKGGAESLQRSMCLTLNGVHTSAVDPTGTDRSEEHFPLWQLENRRRIGLSDSPGGLGNSWMIEAGATEDFSARGCRSWTNPSAPSRRQQKWLVDLGWLEQVRKEHAWLRQQLEIERQRVSALARVEADNRWIEAAIIRALELKRESDTKVADLQQKVGVMEVLMSKRNNTSRRDGL